jgi:hypothetical protein
MAVAGPDGMSRGLDAVGHLLGAAHALGPIWDITGRSRGTRRGRSRSGGL